MTAEWPRSGAQELTQLHTQDIEEVAGTCGFPTAARFLGQKLKNGRSRRFVPLHPAFLEADLLTYSDDSVSTMGEGPLFPSLDAKPGDAISDRWLAFSALPIIIGESTLRRTYLIQRLCRAGEHELFYNPIRANFTDVRQRSARIPIHVVALMIWHQTRT